MHPACIHFLDRILRACYACRYKAKVEEGLSRLLAFLREEEERERLEEVERLKPIGTPVGAYLEYRCKAEVGQVLKTDAGDVTVDNRCWIRHGHSITQVGGWLFARHMCLAVWMGMWKQP